MTDVDPFRDPIAFARFLRVPETGAPLIFPPAQERFLREFLTPTPEGRERYAEALFSAPKKSLKTTIGALAALFIPFMVEEPYAEVIICANDLEQSQSRVFEQAVRLIRTNPELEKLAVITSSEIRFEQRRGVIKAIAADWKGAAGGNQNLVVLDELWAFNSERAQRLFDELVPVPTRKWSARLVVSYAGFTGESVVLESLYKRGLKGEVIA